MDLYEIEYNFIDEFKANETHRIANVVLYDSEDGGLGQEFSEKLQQTNDNSDYTEVNKMLHDHLDIDSDEDVCFYFDWASIDDSGCGRGTKLTEELQNDFDIHIFHLDYITGDN